ncbi:MAG: ribosome small subunit-dependent GTPase A [Chloroflexi bacterium]|nr:ribosome small subunit-dependent GTPase A [Chloroflexota bacterium]
MTNREQKRWQHHQAAKQMRLVSKQIKRNRQPKPPREREWQPGDLDDLDENELPQTERVMPVGEQERRRTQFAAALTELADDDIVSDDETSPLAMSQGVPDGVRATVVEISSSLCRVEVGGHSRICNLRGSLSATDTGYTNVVAVGDEVIITPQGVDQGVVESIFPRRSALVRPDVFYGHLQQVIVANADQLLIIGSWSEPALWLELVDRYLITAERYHLTPIVCINKIDLAVDVAVCQAALQPYVALGYPVLFASALSGAGVAELCDVLRAKTTVLAGLSGVGKSSLLSAVQPGLNLRASAISSRLQGGRHTTTQVTMLALQMGGFVVDTPGVREFGLHALKREELLGFYPDLAGLAQGCRFNNCSHLHEPDCAVRTAVEQGRLSAARYHNYTCIYADLPV